MVNSCSANGCKNRNTKGGTLTFHRFPLNNKHMLKLWLYQIKRGNWEPSKYSVICSEHFTEDSFVVKGQNNRRTLKNDACPTIFTLANYTEPPKKKRGGPRDRSLMEVDAKEEEEDGVKDDSVEENGVKEGSVEKDGVKEGSVEKEEKNGVKEGSVEKDGVKGEDNSVVEKEESSPVLEETKEESQ